jgi:hypothetical protein
MFFLQLSKYNLAGIRLSVSLMWLAKQAPTLNLIGYSAIYHYSKKNGENFISKLY